MKRRQGVWTLLRDAGLPPGRMVGIALLIASVFTGLFTLQGILMAWPAPSAVALRIFAWQAIPWMLWAALAVPVFWLLDRVDPGGRPLGIAVALHLLLGGVVAGGHVVLLTAVSGVAGLWPPDATVVERTIFHLRRNLFTNMVHYAMLALAYHLVRMVASYRASQETVQRREEQLAAARLEALQRQLQPHFLFNALNAASFAARVGSARDAARLIAALGDLLRGAITLGDRQEVPLAEELDFLDRFLFIQQARFADRLHVALAVGEEVRRAAVPPLLVETLVENAIKHGIERLDRPGTVHIRAERVGARLRIEVENDGPAPVGDGRTGPGTGIRNARARLRELYGANARLSLGPRNGAGGAAAVVDLPYRAMSTDDTSQAPATLPVAFPATGATDP